MSNQAVKTIKISASSDDKLELYYNNIVIPEQLDQGPKIILPAFADLHFHWVQDEISLADKTDLFHWLEKYAYPTEAKFSNPQLRAAAIRNFIPKLISAGTLYGAVYGSLHPETVTDFFAALPEALRKNFIVGSPNMITEAPDYLLETAETSLSKTNLLAAKYKNNYAVSPRFLPSVTIELLDQLSKISRANNSWLQTHLAETDDPIESDWNLLEATRALGPSTILAHCLYLDDKGWQAIAKSKSKIAHCPSSNSSDRGLGSGLFDYERAEAEGIDWALASDIGAGPYLSMLDVMKSFITEHKSKKSATSTKALYRATLKGCEILGIKNSDKDFVLLNADGINLEQKPEYILEELLSLSREELAGRAEATYCAGVLLNN